MRVLVLTDNIREALSKEIGEVHSGIVMGIFRWMPQHPTDGDHSMPASTLERAPMTTFREDPPLFPHAFDCRSTVQDIVAVAGIVPTEVLISCQDKVGKPLYSPHLPICLLIIATRKVPSDVPRANTLLPGEDQVQGGLKRPSHARHVELIREEIVAVPPGYY